MTSSLLQSYFGQISHLPCWQAVAEFGTWLSLSFGEPHIHIREGNPEAESERLQRRQAYVQGDFLLWIEMGEWEYLEGGKRLFHSQQPRARLRRTASRLQSQCLSLAEVISPSGATHFHFDLGGLLKVRPAVDAEPANPLWHFYARDSFLTLLADGSFQRGPLTTR